MTIAENIAQIDKRISAAAAESGRSAADITVVAVTKNVGIDKIREAQQCGINIFGENRAQELLSKYDDIVGAKWHFIGHLQTNKVKDVIDKVELIHSVDSLHLAREINRQAERVGKVQRILLQLNISGEESKHGFEYNGNIDEFEPVFEQLYKLHNVKIDGIMTIAPLTTNNNILRNLLTKCKQVSLDIQKFSVHNVNINTLSMGMSNDFELSISCGSNMVRIGSAIFATD